MTEGQTKVLQSQDEQRKKMGRETVLEPRAEPTQRFGSWHMCYVTGRKKNALGLHCA